MPDAAPPAAPDPAALFSEHRPRLLAIAHRMLGSPWAAEDAVQEAWFRLHHSDTAAITNPEAWLTTVLSRICIDMIRRRTSRPEVPDGGAIVDRAEVLEAEPDPCHDVMVADDVALALQVVLDTLGPLERLAVVLHDVFALSYDDIAPIVDRSPVAARQLASRGRARLRSVDVNAVRERGRTAVTAFLEAARNGEFGRLLQLLDPEIELRSDDAAVALATAGAAHGAPPLATSVQGADAVARVFAGRAAQAHCLVVNGVPAGAYVSDGMVHAIYLVTITDNRITAIDVLADPDVLASIRTN